MLSMSFRSIYSVKVRYVIKQQLIISNGFFVSQDIVFEKANQRIRVLVRRFFIELFQNINKNFYVEAQLINFVIILVNLL